MEPITLFLAAISLAMDAFAVSAANGIAIKNVRIKDALSFGAYFGSFQFLMPVAGWWLGQAFYEYASAYSHWVAFVMLAFIGGKMLWETFRVRETEQAKSYQKLTVITMIALAVATSIDALAVGVSFALMDVNVWFSASVIGIVAFALSFAGVLLGKQLGNVFKTRAEQLGGVILILIGLKILVENLLIS